MATKPSEFRNVLAAIANRVASNRAKLVQSKANVSSAAADLASMPTAYGSTISDINAYAAANPGNTFAQSLKAEKDALVAEFQTLNTTATAMEAHLAGDDPST